MGNSDCSTYVEMPETCGAFDDMDWTANVICCACGGGMRGSQNEADEAENVATDLSAGVFNLGDQDLYVIYPTTEKSLDRPRYEFPLAGNNTKARDNDCTKVVGFQTQDTL